MRALRLFARLVVALLALTCVSKPHERTCGVYAHSNITNEPEFVEECLAALLEPLAFSCQGARVHGPLALPGGGNGTTATTAALRQPGITTRVLLGAVFQYCTDDGVTRPVRVLVPPTTTGSLVAAAAKAITDAFADFPYRRRPLITNFTQPASLRAYEDEVLRAAADRASALLHAIAASPPEAEDGANGSSASHSSNISRSPIPSYDTIFMTYATMQLFERQDIHPALLGLVTYADELSAVPLDGSQLLLYVRRDADQLVVTVNATGGVMYEQARRAAVAGFCFPPSPRVLGDLALAVLASLVQLSGPQQGMYLNPDTLQPATTTAAMPYVLSYLRRLAAYSAPVAFSAGAPQFSNDFALGRCAMTVGTAAQFRRNSHAAHPAGPSAVIGRVTATLLPGSDVVLSTDGRELVGCTADTCPHSETVARGVWSGTSSTTGGTTNSHRRLLATLGSNAPAAGLAGGLDGTADVMAQLYSWTLLSNFGGPAGSWTLLLQPSAGVGPWRSSHLEGGAVDRWSAAGFEAADTQSFLAAARNTLAHPNYAPPLRTRTALQYTRAVQDAVWTLLDAPPIVSWSAMQEQAHQRGVAQALKDSVGLLYGADTAPVPRAVLLAEYRSSLEILGSPNCVSADEPPQQGSGGQSKSASAAVAGGIVAAVCFTVLAVLALLLVYRVWRRRGLGRRLSSNWRVLEAPSASPDTALLVTDIEGSTSLWEALPEEVMDRALRVHHITVRTVGRKYSAYESATEGDSFILAFACTANAAQFALELQRTLLMACWPEELLEVPGCAPVYVRKLDWVAKANQVSLVPAPTRFGGAALPHASGPGAMLGEPSAAHNGRGRRSSIVLEALASLSSTVGGGSGQLSRMLTSGLNGADASTRIPAAMGALSAAASFLSAQRLSELQASRHLQLSVCSRNTAGTQPADATSSTEPAAREGVSTQKHTLQQPAAAELPRDAQGAHGSNPVGGNVIAGADARGRGSMDNNSGGEEGGRQQQIAGNQHAGAAATHGGVVDAAAAEAAAVLPSGLSDVPQLLPALPSTLLLRPSDLALAFNFAPQHRVVSAGGIRPRAMDAAAAAGASSYLSFGDVLHTTAPASTLGVPPLASQRGGIATQPFQKGLHVHLQALQHQSSGGDALGHQQATTTAALETGKKVPSFGTNFWAAAAAAAAAAGLLGPGEFSVHGGKKLAQRNSLLQLQPPQQQGQMLGIRGWSLPRQASRNRAAGGGAAGATVADAITLPTRRAAGPAQRRHAVSLQFERLRCMEFAGGAVRTSGGGAAPCVTPVYPAVAGASLHEDATHLRGDGPVDLRSLAKASSQGSLTQLISSSGATAVRRGPCSAAEPRSVMETLVEEATQQLTALMSNAPLPNIAAGDRAAGGSATMEGSGLVLDDGNAVITAGNHPAVSNSSSQDGYRRLAEDAAAARLAANRRETREAAALGIIIGTEPRTPLLPHADDYLDWSLAYNAQLSNQVEYSAERAHLTTIASVAGAPKTAPPLLGVPVPGSLLELLRRVFVPLPPGVSPRQDQQQQLALGVAPSETQLVFAGLRVRVGLHCGVTDARDIQYNAATARMTFGGEGLRIAKAVCDCASGGQVVMSGEVLLRLQATPTASGGMLIPHQGQTRVLDLGDHQLLEAVAAAAATGATAARHGQPATRGGGQDEAVPVSRHLLSIMHATLLGRLSLMPPVRSAIHQYTPGFMDAPVGESVTVVVFRVAQASALLAWNAQAAADALTLIEIYLRASLGPLVADVLEPEERRVSAGGAMQEPLACYLAAAPPGSPFGTFVAGFSQPAAAARWALTAVARTAELPWPAELLDSQWGRPLDKVTRAEAEAVTGADATASGAATPLKFVRRRASRHLGAGASGGSGGGANSSSRHRLPNVAGATGVRSVPTSPLFGSMPRPPAADTAGPSGSTPPGSRAGGGGSSCDGGTPAGTAAGSSFRSNRSGPLFERVLQRSSSSRMTPSLATGGHHSDHRGTSAAGTPLPAALGSGGGGGGLSTGRNARARSAFGGTQSDSPSSEAMVSAARASYSKSDVGGLQRQLGIQGQPSRIFEGGESAVELIPLETMESEDDFEAADEPSGLHQRHPGGCFSTMLKTEPWTSAPPPSNEDSGRGPTLTQLMPQRRSGQYGAAGGARAVTGRSATAGGGKGSIAPHVAGLMHARLSAPQPVVLPQGYGAAAGRSSARSRTGAGDALLFPLAPAAAFIARNVSSAHSTGTPSGFPQQPSRLAPNALQYPTPGASAASAASGAYVFAPAPSTVRAGSASTATATALACSSTAVAAASAFASAAGPAVLALAGSIPEDETTHHSLDQLQERLSTQQRSVPIGLIAAAALSALTGAQQPPLHEVMTAAAAAVRQPFPARASMASPVHAEITPAEADEDSGGAAAASTVGRLSDAVSCPVAALTQQREASGALESMYSGTSGFSRLGTMGRRLDDVMPSPEASGMLRSFAMEAARAIQEGGSSSRASGKRLSASTVTHVARLASPAYSTSNGGRAGHEPTSPLMSTAGTAGLDARHFGTPSQQGHGSSGANSGFRALQVLVGNRRAPQTGGRELSAPGLDAHGRGVLSTPATAPSAAADVVAAAAARAEEDAEVVSFRGLRVRLGMAVGPVAVQLCPLTGRVVYSGKTVSAAASVAAPARLGTMYVTQEAAEALSQGGARLVKLPEPEERPRQSKSLLLLPVSVGGSLAVDQKPSGTRRRASALSFLLGVRPSVPAGLPLRLAAAMKHLLWTNYCTL
eukprot:XP_001693211.1 predicted protein [Chlamydomonas reinhardtii]